LNYRPHIFSPETILSWRAGTLAAVLLFGAPLQGAAPAAGTAAPAASGGTVAASGLASSATPAKPADTGPEPTKVNRPEFSMEYPATWKEDTQAKDYDPNANFMLFSQKNSSVQFIIMNRADDPKKVVDNAVKKIDGVQITSLSRSSLSDWGGHKGVGLHLKGKIVDSFPGGIKVFCFSSAKHNVLVIETYFSDELRDVQDDIDHISKAFTMKE